MALCPLQPLSKQKSLLSQLLLQEQRAQASEADGNGQYEMDSECDVENDEDVGCSEGGEEDAEGFEECADEEIVSPNSPSKPIAIRRPEGSLYLHAQRDAHKRFLYLQQLEELRRHAEAYFANQQRLANTGLCDQSQALTADQQYCAELLAQMNANAGQQHPHQGRQ